MRSNLDPIQGLYRNEIGPDPGIIQKWDWTSLNTTEMRSLNSWYRAAHFERTASAGRARLSAADLEKIFRELLSLSLFILLLLVVVVVVLVVAAAVAAAFDNTFIIIIIVNTIIITIIIIVIMEDLGSDVTWLRTGRAMRCAAVAVPRKLYINLLLLWFIESIILLLFLLLLLLLVLVL